METCCSTAVCGVLMALGVPMAGLMLLAMYGMAWCIVTDIEDAVSCWFRRRAHANDLAKY